MNFSRRRSFAFIATAVLVCAPILLTAGPLDPPPGPVAATGRTQIFSIPVTIDAPGSYVVMRHLERTPGGASGGIIINSDNVTVDLNGYCLNGQGNPPSSMGVSLNGHANVRILNGTIARWTLGVGGDTFSRCGECPSGSSAKPRARQSVFSARGQSTAFAAASSRS